MHKTEFFDFAVRQGYYGKAGSGLFGKKDNARKYWEDIVMKLKLKQFVEKLCAKKEVVKVLDLGCGSGEGYELLTNLPAMEMDGYTNTILYTGVDISGPMIEQGKINYSENPNVRFLQCDFSTDTFFLEEGPFDLIISTYSSPSHLNSEELSHLINKILSYHTSQTVILLDFFGKYSPEWPQYWRTNPTDYNPYNMMWLNNQKIGSNEKIDEYLVTFWSRDDINELLTKQLINCGRKAEIKFSDRSVFIGRHIDTGYYNNYPQSIRNEVNRLFDRDYRGNPERLRFDSTYLEEFNQAHPEQYSGILKLAMAWNRVIDLLAALYSKNGKRCSEIISLLPENLKEDAFMLIWLAQNSDRFPVVDFWASVMGPQVACVLRNYEIRYNLGLGFGHGLICTIELQGSDHEIQ